MPLKPRQIIDTPTGKILYCTGCKNHQPLGSFQVDRADPTGRGHHCRICREGDRKCLLIDGDWSVIPVKNIKLSRRQTKTPERFAPESWTRIARHAQLLNASEVIRVPIKKDYQSHHSAHYALQVSARRIGLSVSIMHGLREIYVRPGVSKPGHENGRPR
jgi:hypothetical protein